MSFDRHNLREICKRKTLYSSGNYDSSNSLFRASYAKCAQNTVLAKKAAVLQTSTLKQKLFVNKKTNKHQINIFNLILRKTAVLPMLCDILNIN